MNATATPSKVAPIGASHQKYAEGDERYAKGNTRAGMPVALMVWAVAPILAVAAGFLIASWSS